MIAVLQGITAMVLLQLAFAVWNAARLPVLGAQRRNKQAEPADAQHRKKPAKPAGTQVPSLSVLIPARDEAANITACLTSVLACSTAGRHIEIIVLDDRSADGTAELAAAAGGPRTQVLAGAELPEGWAGKCHACAQLAEAAGESGCCSLMRTSACSRRRLQQH